MTAETYWISKTFVVDWKLTDPTTGQFVPGATVTGTATLPNLTTAPMTITALTDRYRATYDPTLAGLYAYRLTSTGTADSAEEGTFIVRASLAGAPLVTVDPTTDLGVVRLLISDTDVTGPVFTDAEITAFLTLEGGNTRLAAAQALDTIASNEVMISKVIRTADLQTDGSKVAAELRARASGLRAQAAASTDFAMDIVDFDAVGWQLDVGSLGV